MKKGHHYLLMMIQSARLNGRYHDRDGQFTLEEIKAELSHRPHIPKGKEGKERRRLLAQGKIQK